MGAAVVGDAIEPRYAGIVAKGLDPRAVRVMAEAGVDISGQASKTVEAVRAVPFDLVVTVCSHAAIEGLGAELEIMTEEVRP